MSINGPADGASPGEGAPARAHHWLNAARVRVYSWMIVAIFAAVLVAWVALSLPLLVDPRGKPIGYDFMAYWSAARLVLEGRPEAAYDENLIAAIQHAAVHSLPGIVFPWHYPPIFLLVVVPLGLLPYPAALAGFIVATAALWAALVRRILPDRRAWIVAAAAPAGLITLLDGQNAFLTAAIAGFALLCLERRQVVAGVLIGLLAVKPQLAVLFPLALLAEGRWRTIAAAAATVLALVAASLLTFGWETWAIFLHHLPRTQAMEDAGAVPWGTMPTPYVFALSLGASVAAARVLQGAVALFAAFCVWRAWRNRDAPFEAKAATLVTASLLVSPYLFYYDLLWAALAIAWLAILGLQSGFRRGEREIYLFAWLAPVLMPPVQLLTSVQLGFPALLLLLLAAIRRAAPLVDTERRRLHRAIDVLREARWITRERVMRLGVGFAAMSLALLAVHVVTHTTRGLTDAKGNQLANDFVIYWSGAHLAATGQASHAADLHWFYGFVQSVTGRGSAPKIYAYPPIAMLLTLPLGLLGFVPGLIVWTLTGAGLCFELMRRLIGWRAAAVATVGAPAAFLNLLSGQNGYFTAALFAGGLMILDARPVFAGVCFGCLAYKPQLGVLLPVALAAGGHWRAFVAAGVTVALLGLGSLALFGGAPWSGFFDQMVVHRHLLEFDASLWHRMPTVFVAVRVLGAALPVAYAVQAISGALALLAVAVMWRSSAPIEIKAATVAVATYLATPYAWDYDGVVLIFAAAWLGREGMRRGFLPWERTAIIALLGAPLLTMATTRLVDAQLGPVVLWLVLLVLLRRGIGYLHPPRAADASHAALASR